MPVNIFGYSSSSYDNGYKIDTSVFVQKLYLRTICKDSNIDEDVDLKIQFRNKSLLDPINIKEAASRKYVDNKFNDPSIIKNTAHVEFADKNQHNVRSIEVNSFPTLEEHLTPKIYVDQAFSNILEESLLRRDPNEKLILDEQDSIVLTSSLTTPKTIIDLPSKSYVDRRFNVASIIRNNTHVDFKDKNLDNVRFVKRNSMPAVREHLTPSHYVDQAILYHVDEKTILRLDPETIKLDQQDSIFLNSTLTSTKTITELSTKSYVDSLHESSRNRSDLSSVFNDQVNEFDNNKLTNLDSITINGDPNLSTELANKNYIDDELDKNTLLRFNQTLQNYLKVSVGNDT